MLARLARGGATASQLKEPFRGPDPSNQAMPLAHRPADLPRRNQHEANGASSFAARRSGRTGFCALVLGQALVREDFELTHHLLSLLALAEWGDQDGQFCDHRACRRCRGLWPLASGGSGAPALASGAYAAGLLVAAAFPLPPPMNFPPGSVEPDSRPASAMLHGLGFGLANLGRSVPHPSPRSRIAAGSSGRHLSLAAALLPPAITA